MRKNFVIYSDGNGLDKKQIKALEKAVYGFQKSDVRLAVELSFVDEEEIQRLNRELRSTDRVTDVLSFPALENIKGEEVKKKDHLFELDEKKNLLIGSIAICEKRAREQAEEYGHSYQRELHYLTVHGIMHCLGYDHETPEEKAEMREKEEEVLGKLGIGR